MLLKNWSAATVADSAANAERWFSKPESNVGILLGAASGGLVDVDLDCPEAVALAPSYLPPTRTFGRTGRRASHWLYVAVGAQTLRLSAASPAGGTPDTLVELRAEKCQTVFPGSTHVSGESVEWTDVAVPVASVDAADLRTQVLRLAAAALLVRGGMSAEAARDAVLGNVAELDVKGADQVRRWLGVKPPRPGPTRRRPPNADVRAAVAEVNVVAQAVARYVADHPSDWPKAGGTCPGCGHAGCFGRLADAVDRWVCFSAGHLAPGVAGDRCHTGDVLDLDAHAAQITVVDLLRREGYLPPHDSRPQFDCLPGEGHRAIAFALGVVAQDDGLYQHGSRLAVVADPGPNGADDERGARIVPVGDVRIWEALSRRAQWRRLDRRSKEFVRTDPPEKVVSAVVKWDDWRPVRVLAGVVAAPILRRDGALVDRPGYDPVSRLYFAPRGPIPVVPALPTLEDAVRAASEMLEVIADFPLVAPSHRSAWLAALTTVAARPAFDGPAPMFVVDANTRGSGKSLLFDLVALIANGAPMPRSPFAEEDDEMRKRITAHVLAGAQTVLIDNIPNGGTVGWASLDALLTARVWSDRILGRSEIVSLPANAVYFASGNNVAVRADLARRVLKLRLESLDEKPEERSGFKHDPLEDWVLAERTRLLAAALTVVRAYLVAGSPPQAGGAMGSFGGWCRLIRGALVWAGQPDPLETWAARDVDADPDASLHVQLLSALVDSGAESNSMTAAELLDRIELRALECADLRRAVYELCGTRDGHPPTARLIGERLRRLKGRRRTIADGRLAALGQDGKTRSGVVRWRVEVEVLGQQGPQGRRPFVAGHLAVDRPDGGCLPFSSERVDHDNAGGAAGTRPSGPRSPSTVATEWSEYHDFEEAAS